VGLLVLSRRPRDATGWILVICGTLVGLQALTKQWAFYGGVSVPGSLPAVGLATWLSGWTFAGYWPMPTLLALLFPDGRLPSRRWRPFLVAIIALQVLAALAAAFRPGDVDGIEQLTNPLAIGDDKEPFLAVMGIGSALGFGLAAPVCAFALLRRLRRSTGRERVQLQWLLLGFVTCIVLGAGSTAFSYPTKEIVFALGLLAIPASIGVAVLRAGLFDISVVVNRAVVYSVLTGVGVLVWLGVIAVAGTSVGDGPTGAITAAVVAVVATMGRTRAQRLVDRWLFGARSDPYRVVERLGADIDAATDHAEALQSLVRAVGEGLRLPYVALQPADGEPVVVGHPVAGVEDLPIVVAGRRIATLHVGHRHRGEQLRPAERSLLDDVARRAGSLLHAAALTDDLRRSRDALVATREEERRRLRRDLHDGVGPMLASMALQLDGLGRQLPPDDAVAERLRTLRGRVQESVTEVRRIVDGLRPSAVDELGLGEALRALAPDAAAVQVAVDDAGMETLPAAVEVAAYRIAGEAMTNAVRHAGATQVELVAAVHDGELVVEVRDDGHGFAGDAVAGVGLQSMYDRAAEVGGRLAIDTAGAGTVVRALLPVQGP
jgi:signal transduction histidine kinase